VLLVVGLLAAPPIIKRVIESSLEDMPGGYRGTIAAVDLRPLSAEIAMVGFKIEKKNGKVPVPYIDTEEFVLGTVRESWKLRTVLRIRAPIVSLVDAPSKEAQQWGPKVDLAKIRKQLPFELTRVEIERAQVHFRNFHAKPQVDVYLRDANVTWEKLVGCLPPGSASCRSHVRAEAGLMKSGRAELEGTFERSPEPHTQIKLDVEQVKARELSPLLSEYAKVDVQGGLVSATMRYVAKATDKSFRIIPRLSDLDVVGGDRKDTRFFREVGLAAAAGWFERKTGEKAIVISSKNGGKFDFNIVDLGRESADAQKDQQNDGNEANPSEEQQGEQRGERREERREERKERREERRDDRNDDQKN
jgi:hypothetical protein